jgi:hypothetical protein
MTIIERYIASKYGDMKLCEDGIFANEHYIAVIDGVTSKGKLTWKGATGGFHAKEILKNALSALDGSESKELVFQTLNNALYQQYQNADFFYKNPEERLQATLVIYSVHAAQIWRFGDCQFMLNGTPYADEMKIDGLLAEVRSIFLELELLGGTEMASLLQSDPSSEIIFPILKRQSQFANMDCEYGFAVLDGFCKDFSRIECVNVPQASEVILASDGYPRLCSTLEESENFLVWLRENDPLCIRSYKSTRGFTNGKTSLDDRAYIRFTA